GNTVSGVIPPTPADFYRSWTLANHIAPLPIELISWSGTCDGSIVKLSWTTASEQDNSYFTVEKSKDATTWTAVGQLPGAGNSSSQIQYVYTDPDASGLAYYRLRQTDIDGVSTVSPTVVAGCDADNGTRIVNAWDDGNSLNVVVASSLDGIYDLTLLDAQGKLLLERPAQAISTGSTTLLLPTRSIASGIYVVRLQNATNSMSRRVHLN
ncbi:MAG: T9SS type A sorting domain-containing protein, partial [Flavobacteriales bacterium]